MRCSQAQLAQANMYLPSVAGSDSNWFVLQNQALLKMTRCSVCDSRQKDRILTKCWHMFCQQCIQRNLETRHRKCPGCGAAFGAADVKAVYLG
jgi:Zinc finger, C3HC4 type (RING finger)